MVSSSMALFGIRQTQTDKTLLLLGNAKDISEIFGSGDMTQLRWSIRVSEETQKPRIDDQLL